MSILTKPEILKAIKKKIIRITPFDAQAVGPASIDLTLDNKFRTFKKGKTIDATEDYQTVTTYKECKTITLKPQEAILGITREKIKLPSNICGWLLGRSRFARLGLMVHITAPFMHPGINNKQVLEIVNVGQRPIKLHAGTKICQFVFQKTLGNATYNETFVNQMTL